MSLLLLTKTVIMIIIAIARARRRTMKKKIWIIPDNVAFYYRVGNKSQIDDNLLILTKKEAIDLFEKLKTKLLKEQKIPKLLIERGDNYGIF